MPCKNWFQREKWMKIMTSTIVQPPLQPGQTQFNPLPIRSQLALKGVVSEVLPSKAIPPTSNQLRPINPSNHSNESNLQTLILSQPPTGTPTTPPFPPLPGPSVSASLRHGTSRTLASQLCRNCCASLLLRCCNSANSLLSCCNCNCFWASKCSRRAVSWLKQRVTRVTVHLKSQQMMQGFLCWRLAKQNKAGYSSGVINEVDFGVWDKFVRKKWGVVCPKKMGCGVAKVLLGLGGKVMSFLVTCLKISIQWHLRTSDLSWKFKSYMCRLQIGNLPNSWC